MRHITSLLLLLLLSTHLWAGNLQAYFTYCTFNSPNKGPYIETYLSVMGGSAIYGKTERNTFQGEIEVTLIFKQEDQVKAFKKYKLLSPEINDSLSPRVNFMDQQRIPLPNGTYEFEFLIQDLNASTPPFSLTQTLKINYPTDTISISDIELVESLKQTTTDNILSKSGYDIVPYTSDFYSEEFEKIAFYTEVYNADTLLGKNEDFLMAYFIESFEGGQLVGHYKKMEREKTKPVNILLASFAIDQLPSGNYNLVVEARSKKNELLAQKKVFFQRSNPDVSPLLMLEDYQSSFVSKFSKSELIEFIKSTEPIATNIEADFAQHQIDANDDELMRQYFYNFWVKRDSEQPAAAWNNYYKKVQQVNDLFSTAIKKGYTTDRGRIFLKYDKPNTRSKFPSEPNAYPYEIWHYYKIENFSNKRFVFYSRDLSTNEYPLIHSTMPGFITNPQWKILVHRRTNETFDLDTQDNINHEGGRATDYYNNPR